MKLKLLACTAQRPDRRAIANCINEIAMGIDTVLAQELSEILLEGDSIDLELTDKNSGSALRALRKLNIDYEIQES